MKFLIVKTSSLGDIIHTFPVIGFLKQKFPGCQIDWIVESSFAELLETHPAINRVYCVETKNWRRGSNLKAFLELRRQLQDHHYDVLFDLQGNTKSGLLTFIAKAKHKVGFAWKNVSEWFNLLFTNWRAKIPTDLNVRKEYLQLVQTFFMDNSEYEDKGVILKLSPEGLNEVNDILKSPKLVNQPRIMVCPGSAWPNKRLGLPALIEWLQGIHQQYGCSYLFIWGNEEERKIAEQLHQQFSTSSLVVPKLAIPVLQNLMDRMDLVIAMDSFPLHLAGTTRTSTFSVFGASSRQKYQPFGSNHDSFQGPCPYNQTFERRCPRLRTCKTGACIRSLDGKTVLAAFGQSGIAQKLETRIQK